MKLKIVIGAILSACLGSLMAQETSLLRGYVFNSETGEYLENVRVLQKGGFNMTRSDASGYFELKTDRLPVDLVLAHPKHQTRELQVNRDSLVISLQALSSGWDFPEAEEDVRSFDRISARVRDFRFYDQLIFILGNSGREVRMINHRGSLVERELTPAKVDGLAEDCLGTLYAYNDDSAYAVFYNYDEIHFFDPMPASEFRDYVMPCRCFFEGGLIYTVSQRRDLVTSVRYANEGIVATIKEFADSSALQLLNERYGPDYFITRGLEDDPSQGFLGQLSPQQLAELQEEARLGWFDSYLIRPNKVYAFVVEDQLLIADLKEMKLYRYHEVNTSPEEEELKYPAKNAQRMLLDEANDHLYILYKKKSKIRLQPLFQEGKELNTDEFAFPKKVQIHNGQVYFISSPSMDGSNFLFRLN